ncbi:MAG: hypothetical protein OEY91_12900 [Nitrospirota bacterium]|nr:hypothetical protein [Nitrospirota bacterium]
MRRGGATIVGPRASAVWAQILRTAQDDRSEVTGRVSLLPTTRVIHSLSFVIPDICHRGSIRKEIQRDFCQRPAGVTQRGKGVE